MQDAAFKMLFRHPLTVEMLVRKHAPDHCRRIDFSTLQQLGTEQVGEALVRRYPDMLWTARNHGGAGQVIILLEFQGRPERLMALRMAIYQLLTVQEVIRRARPSVRTDSIEVLSFVIHHGRRPWGKAPSLRQLFGRC